MPEQEELSRRHQLHQQHQGRDPSPFQSTILNTNTPEHQSQLLEWSRQFLQAETTSDLPTLFQFISKQTNNNDKLQIIAPDSSNMGGEGHLDLAEALALTPFATLKKGGDDSADGAAARPDRLGRTIMCSPQNPLASTQQRAPLGIIFRVGDVVEAIQLSAPTIPGGGEEEEETNVEGGDMKIIGTLPLDNIHQVAKIACSDDARLLLVGYSNGTITCLDVLFAGNDSELAAQFQLRWTMSTGFEGATVQFPTLEFLHGDLQHHFLAVIESINDDQSTQTIWIDAASSTSAPPSKNLWPIGDADGTVTCATPCPSEGDTIAFGTNTGKLGMYCGGNIQYLDHPLLDYEEEDGPWKITHLNWFNPTSLAVGLTRVIIDLDAEDDDGEEDDPNQHEANLLMGTLEQGTWSFTELGDVVPFFSVPKGGRHVFYTAILPTATSCMMLAGCNVGSDIALLCNQNDEWNIVELMEGSQMACPTDEDDEFLYPLGLSVVMSTMASSGQHHPFAMLASTDGSVMGFAPQHRTHGEGFFSRQLSNIGFTEGMAVPIAVSEGAVSEVMPSPELAAAVLAEGGCILSGLDLGLDTVVTENNAAPSRPSLDSLFDGNDEDDNETNDSASSLDSLDSDDWGQGETPPKDETPAQTSSGLMSGMAAPSFSFGGGTFKPPSSPTKPAFGSGGTTSGFSFGGAGGTKNTFGSAFGVTSTTFGAFASAPPSSPTPKAGTQSAAPAFGSSAPVFGSSAPVFGSTAASSEAIGFGALASASAGIKTNGFGTGINLDDIKKEGESQKEAAPPKEAPKESPAPAPAAPVVGSGSAPAFGSSASTSTGFGAMAASASSSGQGFGVKAEDKKDEEKNKEAAKPPSSSAAFPPMSATAPKNPFSAKPTSSAAFPPMSAAAPKPFGSSIKEEELKETPSAAPAPVFGSGSATVFGSGTKPTFGFKSTGFAASFSPSGSATSGTTKTSPFGAFGSSTPFGSSSMAPGMAKPLFGDKPNEAKDDKKEEADAGVPQSTTPDKAEESKSSTKDEISEIDKDTEELLKTSPGKKAMDVFKAILADTDGSDSSLPASKFEPLVEEIGEGFHGDELDKQLAIVDPSGSGLITSAAFVKWYHDLVNEEGDDDESSQGSEIAEEKSKAEQAFDKVSQGSAKIQSSDLNKLIEELGTVYCEEEHRRTIKKISSLESGEKVITKEAFVDWYVEWLFGDGDSDSEDEESVSEESNADEQDVNEGGEVKAEGWGSMFKTSEEGCWKCGVCMVSNKPSVTACAACETPKPGEEGKASSGASTAEPASASGSIGAGGFSFGGGGLSSCSDSAAKSSSGIGASGFSFGGFGGASTEKKSEGDSNKTTLSGGITFGVPKSTEAPATTGIGAGGFSFGGFGTKPAEESMGESKPSGDEEEDDIEDLLKTSPGKKAMDVFKAILADTDGSDSSLPASKFEPLVEEIGEGFHGDELDKQLAIVDPSGSGLITSAAFVKWYHDLVNEEGDDDESSQGSEIAEEKSKAEQAFDKVSQGSAKIQSSDLNKLIEELGTVYCEEEHRRTIKKISSLESGEKVITKEAFVDWYVEWLFGDGDSDSEDEESVSDDESEVNTTKESEVKAEGWGSMFKTSEEGSWKCGVCMVSNKPSVTACAACETPKPGEECKASSGASTAEPTSASGSIGAGGFSFGGGGLPSSESTAPKPSGSAFGPSSIGSSGFSFCGASTEKKSEGDSNKTTLSGGITFGVPKKTEVPETTGIGAGGFSFGGFGAKPAEKTTDDDAANVEKSAGSSAFPPMSAAAPKNPFSAKPSSSGAAFPPMSAAAPKPFFGAPAKKEESKPSSSAAAFPPMSKAAPKPFGAFSTPASSAAGAPSPFAAFSKKEDHKPTDKSSSTTAFPPMSKAAPSPFSAFSKKEESKPADKTTTSGSAFPPMSAAAPTNPFSASAKPASSPFGAFSKKDDQKASSSAAFPPMSAAAPKPFGASKTSEKVPSSPAFPPMSKAAPSPFSAFSKKDESKPSSAAFPPMSTAAPKPFASAFGKKEEDKAAAKPPAKPPSSAAAFPPMSAAAPKPFGASFGKKEEDKAVAKPPSSAAAFPPMSAAAPKPFASAFGKKEEDKAAAKPPPSSAAAFPPMSAAAPKPFGASFGKKEEFKAAAKPPPSSAAAFPPMSAAAPKPFGASFGKKEEFKTAVKPPSSAAAFQPISAAAPKPVGATSSSSSTSASTAGRSFSVSSKYEAEIWDQVNRFAKKTSNAKKLQREASSCIPSDLANNIDTMVNKYQENLSKSELHKDHNAAVNKRILQLFSVQDDLTRQKRESNLAIEEQTSEAASSTLARKEPLDADSEKMRRLIVSKCHKVQGNISTVEDRITLNKAIFNCSAGNRRNIRPSEYFNQSSKSQAIGREQKVKDANTALFKSLMGGYDRVRDLKPVVEELSKESTDLSNSQNQRELHQSGAKRTKTKNRLGLPRSNLMSPLRSARRQKSAPSRTSILEDSKSLRQLSSDLQLNPLPKTFYLRGQMRPPSTETEKIPDWRSKGRNELFSSTKPAQTSIVSQPVAASPAVAKNLFSSPLSTTKARSDWSKTSERDRGLLKVNIPQKLKTIDSADAAKAALAKFGTTPEKLAQGRDIISRDAEEAQTPLKVSSNKNSLANKGITASANASFPAATSKTAPSLSLPKSKASAAFPPMPTSAPKPLSQAFKPSVAPAPTASAPASTPSPSTTTPDYKSVLTKFYSENSPGKVGEVDATLRKYEGKESEMFVALAKRYNKPNALNEVFESRVKNIDTKDYLKLATLYLEVFNAAKATPERIEAMLAKYKGKEEAMFASLSQKWYAFNPLEKPKTEPTAAPAQQPSSSETNAFGSKPGMTTSSAPANSPFGTTTPAPAKTTDSAPAPSPFGVAAPAASPFGTTAPAPANSPFGTAASAPAPAAKSSEPDYHKILTEFYQKHNAAKVGEVAKTLEKYKGKEHAMFAKLAQKYQTANPLDERSSSAPAPSSSGTSFGFGGFGASLGGSTKSPFASTTTTSSGASVLTASSSTTAPASNTSAFGGGGGGNAFGASKSPFGSSAPGAHSPFAAAPSPFGGGSAAGSAPAFGASAAPSPSPFGNTPAPASSAFGSMQSPAPSAFGQPPAPTPSGPKFGGRNPRDILVSFYQTHNPTKMNDIDKVLTKYAGKEEQLFLNLAKKYNLDPSIFGVSASSQPSAPTFGSPAAATFGSSAPMGTGFGAPSTGGFGGSGTSGGFGGFAAAAGGGGGFGSLNQMGSSPAGFGGSAAPSFGSQPTPFGSARR